MKHSCNFTTLEVLVFQDIYQACSTSSKNLNVLRAYRQSMNTCTGIVDFTYVYKMGKAIGV